MLNSSQSFKFFKIFLHFQKYLQKNFKTVTLKLLINLTGKFKNVIWNLAAKASKFVTLIFQNFEKIFQKRKNFFQIHMDLGKLTNLFDKKNYLIIYWICF